MVAAATSPPTRLARSGPSPWPRSHSRFAGVVMLFHSSIERMNRTFPEPDDGEIEPKTASWRASHGARTTRKRAKQATAAQAGIAGRRAPPLRQARQRSHAEGERQRRPDQHPVVAGERREADEEAADGERAGVALEAPGAHPERPGDERLVEAEVVGLGHEDRARGRDRDEDPGAERHARARARVPRDRPGEGRRERAEERERERRRERRRSQEPDERHLDERREGHPVGVRGHRAASDSPGSFHRPRGRSRSRRSRSRDRPRGSWATST